MSIRNDDVHWGIGDGTVLLQSRELFFTRQVVINCVEVDCSVISRLGILDKENDGNRSAATLTKNFSSFLTRTFARSSLIALQVIDVNGVEFFCHALTHTVRAAGFKPARICDETDHALLTDSIRCPAISADV